MFTPAFNSNDQLQTFRKKAEIVLSGKVKNTEANVDNAEESKLLHELQVLQVMLEMQNEELKLSEASLAFERGKFTALYDLAPIGYFILDQFGAIDEVNLIGADMLETNKADLLSKRFQDYTQKSETINFYNFLHKMAAPQVRHSCQLKMVTANSKVFYAQIEGISIINSVSGNTQFYIGLVDATESHKAEQRLVESNERLQMTLQASATGTWEIDLEKKHIFFDDYSYKIYGYHPWEFDGQFETFFKKVHPDDVQKVKNVFKYVITEEKEIDLEYRIMVNANTVRYLQIRGHLVNKGADTLRVVGIVIDITERKRFEQEAENLRQDHQKNVLAAALQAQEKERRRISESLHDSVSQLLYAIRLNLQGHDKSLLKTEPFDSINRLLDQAINETRNISFELAPSILNDFGLKEGINEMVKRISTPNFTVKTKLSDIKQRLNPELEISVFRIVQELLNNSIKHGKATEVNLKINVVNDALSIVVSDNGAGFNTNQADYSLKGSGLRSIKNRVNLFYGSMDVNSATGKGTTVTITLKNV